MDRRLYFPAKCPYCKEHTEWLFAANDTGQHFVECEHCGETYVILIDVVPKTVCVYALIKQD